MLRHPLPCIETACPKHNNFQGSGILVAVLSLSWQALQHVISLKTTEDLGTKYRPHTLDVETTHVQLREKRPLRIDCPYV